jgi:hypothetical protein
VSQLLQHTQTALAHLADCPPDVALECAVTFRRRTEEYLYWSSLGFMLNDEALELYTRSDAAGNFTRIIGLGNIDITLTSDGEHYYGCHPEAWLSVAEARLTHPAGHVDPTTILVELWLWDLDAETEHRVVLFSPEASH